MTKHNYTEIYFLQVDHGEMLLVDDGSGERFYCKRDFHIPQEFIKEHSISDPVPVASRFLDTVSDWSDWEEVDATEDGAEGAKQLLESLNDWRTCTHGTQTFFGNFYMVLAHRIVWG